MADKAQVMGDSKSLAAANNKLALQLLRKLSAEGDNVFFSPFSISIAMTMLLRGAKEETMRELMKILGHDSANLSFDEVHRKFGDLFSFLSQNQSQYILDVANAILSQRDFPLRSDYVDDLKQFYQALATEVDFANDSVNAVCRVNGWVSEKTRGKVPKMLESLDPATAIVLLNAVYFKGSWVEKFNPRVTRPENFYNKGSMNLAKEVPMMYRRDTFLYVNKGEYKALELLYEGDDIAMMILLPTKVDGVGELENQLDENMINSLRNSMDKINVPVTLPKFHMEYSKELKPVFQGLGLKTVFNHRIANLEGLSDIGQLEVSSIIHKAVLDVNEEGSEAAAATAVTLFKCCGYLHPPEFRVDRPFLFLIYNKLNDLILFVGRVNEL